MPPVPPLLAFAWTSLAALCLLHSLRALRRALHLTPLHAPSLLAFLLCVNGAVCAASAASACFQNSFEASPPPPTNAWIGWIRGVVRQPAARLPKTPQPRLGDACFRVCGVSYGGICGLLVWIAFALLASLTERRALKSLARAPLMLASCLRRRLQLLIGLGSIWCAALLSSRAFMKCSPLRGAIGLPLLLCRVELIAKDLQAAPLRPLRYGRRALSLPVRLFTTTILSVTHLLSSALLRALQAAVAASERLTSLLLISTLRLWRRRKSLCGGTLLCAAASLLLSPALLTTSRECAQCALQLQPALRWGPLPFFRTAASLCEHSGPCLLRLAAALSAVLSLAGGVELIARDVQLARRPFTTLLREGRAMLKQPPPPAVELLLSGCVPLGLGLLLLLNAVRSSPPPHVKCAGEPQLGGCD
ncbi:MAG: hypothetical protein SGPRY_011007 [Prymnesium sp.]